MSEMLNVISRLYESEFEQIDQEIKHRKAQKIANTTLHLGKVAMEFSRVERVPRYDIETRESDVEHSYMLQLVSVEIAEEHFPDLDSGLIAKFCAVHDLPELLTGDTPTFHATPESLQNKSWHEAQAMLELKHRLPPHTYTLLKRYESQLEPEARFVRFIDKLIPLVVDIHGPGLKVMHEDYNTFTLAEYNEADSSQEERCVNLFPEASLSILHEVRKILSATFAKEFKT